MILNKCQVFVTLVYTDEEQDMWHLMIEAKTKTITLDEVKAMVYAALRNYSTLTHFSVRSPSEVVQVNVSPFF